MKNNYRKIFEEIFKEFEEECNGWLMMNTSLGRSSYNDFYKEKLFEKFEKYRWLVIKDNFKGF